jgi:hypothetical protein
MSSSPVPAFVPDVVFTGTATDVSDLTTCSTDGRKSNGRKQGASYKLIESNEMRELLISYVRSYGVESARSFLIKKKKLNLMSSFNRAIKKLRLRKGECDPTLTLADLTQRVDGYLLCSKAKITKQRKVIAAESMMLLEEEEKYLVELCCATSVLGWGLSKNKLLIMVNDYLEKTGSGRTATMKTVDNLRSRSEGRLTLYGCSSLDVARADQATESVRDASFAKMECAIRQLYAMGLIPWRNMKDVPGRNKYNMDEIGSNTTERRQKVLGESVRSQKRHFEITPEGDKTMPWHITCALTTRGDGELIDATVKKLEDTG